MNNKLVSRTNDGISLECSWLMIALFTILIFTSLNGFIDSIYYEYGCENFWECTFLGEPNDLHADLIKSAISLSSSTPSNIWEWSPHYQVFYLHNPYGKMEDIPLGKITLFCVPPFTLFYLTGVTQAILMTGPVFIVTIFYIVALLGLGFCCWYFISDNWERILAFAVLAFSYPFMLMLTRANIGALLAGFLLIFYIYWICQQRHLILAALCLAVVCNIRPNAILLAPLFLCFGWRKAIGASVLFLASTVILAGVSYAGAASLYPGYSWSVFSHALGNYNQLYVLGSYGDGNNNSAYGAFKTLYRMMLVGISPDQLTNLNLLLTAISAGLIIFLSYKFWRGRLPVLHFAFALTAIYILGSAVFSTYHLLVLYAFIFMAGAKSSQDNPFPAVLLFMSAVMIIPKNYFFFFPGVSCEVILNPLFLSICLGWILMTKFPSKVTSEAISDPTPVPVRKKHRRHH